MADDFESYLQANKGGAQPTTSPLSPEMPTPAAAPTDPFESFLREQKASADAAATKTAQAQVISSQDVAPDTAGRAAQVGRQIGLPQGAVETDLPRYEAQAKSQQAAATLAGNPKLATWAASNPDSARIAKDELDGLNNIDLLVSQQATGAMRDTLVGAARGFGASFVSSALGLNRAIGAAATGVDKLAGTNLSDWWYQHMVAPQLTNRAALTEPANAPFGVKAASTAGNMLGTLLQIMATGGAGEAAQAKEATSAAAAIGQQVAHGARAMAFPSLVSAVNTGKDVYDQTGDVQMAIRAAQMSYATTTLGGVVPLGAEGGLATRLASGFVSGAASGEVSRQAMNLVMPQQEGFDPVNTILSGLSGAMLSGVMGHNPLHDGVRRAFADGLNAETAERGGMTIEQLSQWAQASKLRQYDPEAFKRFVAQAAEDGPVQHVYVDGKTLDDALHQSPIDPAAMPDLGARVQEARATGGDVQIPVEDYATHIAGTPLDAALLPNLKTEEGGMTYAEGQQFFQNTKEEMAARAQEIAQQASGADEREAQLSTINETLLGQMMATGRYPADVARASLAPVTEFYRTMAERTGMEPGKLFEQFPLRIAGENPASETLNQPAQSLDDLRAKWDAQGISHSVMENDKGITLSKVVIPADSRGQGTGTEFMRDLTAYADRQGKTVALTPATDFGGTSVARLKKFYKQFGFVENKGRNKDFEISEAMYRLAQEPGRLDQPARGGFSPDSNTIGLLKGADLSTFLHESGHFFLSTLGDLAGREGAPQQIRDDMQTFLDWSGGGTIEEWGAKGVNAQRDAHEKFARAFEAYLMEGRAPTPAMSGLFARFRAWLTHVYQNALSLGAEVTPEMRGVFDRLLASDQAIREAEAARGYLPLDLSKTDATDAQKAQYLNAGQEATQAAIDEMQQKSLRDMKWASNAKSKAIKRIQQEASEVRGMVRAEAERDVMATPVEQARSYIAEMNLDLNPETATYKADRDQWQANRAEQADASMQAWVKENPEPSIIPQVSGKKPDAKDRARYNVERKAWIEARDAAAEQRQTQWDAANPKPEKPATPLDHWKTERAATERQFSSDVKAEYLAAPEAQGLAGIKKGQYLARNKREMANETERRMLEWEKQHPKPDSATVRVPPDLVAEQFGFASGKDLMEALRAATPEEKINALTDKRMLERHGELIDPKAIEDAANAAVHNEARARFIATGLKILTKSKIAIRDLTKAADEAARSTIAAKKVKDLNPRQFEVAETKSNREALDAAPKDPAAAANAQRQALLSNRLAKAARDAVDEVKKIVSNQARYDKESIRKKMDPDILEQIDALRERFDFRKKPVEGPTKQQASLQNWMDTQKAFGYTPVEHPGMLDPTVRKPYKEMTVEELRGLHDTLRSMEQIAKERKSITIEGKKVDLAEAVGDLVDKMKSRGEKFTMQEIVEPPRAGTDPFFQVALSRMGVWLRSAVSELKAQQFKANQFDTHEILGPFTRAIFNRVFDANYHKIDMLKALANSFRDVASELGKDWQNSLTELVPNDRLIDADLTKETGNTVYRKLTRGDMLGIARHVGNESNFEKLTKGMEWDGRDVWAFLNANMTANDWRATQATWDAFERHWPQMVEMNRRLGNVSPDHIEPRPFTTADGISLKGGYAPIDYDPLRSKLAIKQSDSSAINPSEGLFGRGYFRADTTTNGSLNSRVSYFDRLDLGFHSVERRLHDTIHDLAYREALLDVHKVLSNAEFRRQFNLTYGPEQYKSLNEWVGDLANGQNTDAQMSRLGKIMETTRHMLVANGIALRVSTMVKHGGSAAFKSAGYFSGGGVKYFQSRAARMATDHAGQIKGAIEKFSEIRARAMQQDRDFRQTTASLFEPESFHSKAERFGHAAVAYLDLCSAVPTAWGAYDRAITEGIPKNRGGTGGPMSEEDAVAYANQIVREAHGSNIESARSGILQSKSEAVKMMTTLYGFMNNSLGQTMDMADKLRTSGFSKPEVLARFLMASIVPALAAGVVEKQHKGEGWAMWAAKAITGEFAGMVPGLRDAWSAIKGFPDAGISPLMRALSSGGKPFKDAWDAAHGKQPKAPIKDAGNAIGLLIPGAGQIGTTLQYAADVKTGKQHPKNAVDVARGLAFGQGNSP